MSAKMTGSALENYNFQKIVAVVGISLLLVKFFAYYLTSSVAILTDALESIVNVIAAFIGLFALYLSAQPPDRNHPYGHGKVETISASVEGTLITVAGVMIVGESVYDLIYHPNMISDLDIGLLLIIFAAAVNYITGTIAIRKGKKNHSPALQASGKHLCTDTYSSIGIIIGLTVVYIAMKLGYDVWWMDPLLALMFGAFIITTGIRVIRSCLKTMMDTADEGILAEVVRCLNENRSNIWIDIHNLRMIKYGTTMHIDMHVTLPPYMTIAQMKHEEEVLMQSIHSKFGESVDLTLSPEPCEGFNCRHCMNDCPDRKERFSHLIEWNVDILIQNRQHGEFVNVFIDLEDRKK